MLKIAFIPIFLIYLFRIWLADSMYGKMVVGDGGLKKRRAIALDVEPSLRAICRSEQFRTQTDRPGSRFYHYLRNASLDSFSASNIFDRHCEILQEVDKKYVCNVLSYNF